MRKEQFFLRKIGNFSYRPHILEPDRVEKYRRWYRLLWLTVFQFLMNVYCWVVLWILWVFASSVHVFRGCFIIVMNFSREALRFCLFYRIKYGSRWRPFKWRVWFLFVESLVLRYFCSWFSEVFFELWIFREKWVYCFLFLWYSQFLSFRGILVGCESILKEFIYCFVLLSVQVLVHRWSLISPFILSSWVL